MSDYMVSETTGPVAVRYRRIVTWIHWVIAILVVMQVIIGFTFHDMPRGPDRTFVFGWHKTWGALILVLSLVRLAVRLMNPPPPYPADQPAWKRFVAVWTHRLFYILMIALPLTGLIAVSDGARNGLVDLQLGLSIPAVPGISEDVGEASGELHELLVWVTLGLLALHVAAALFNQFVDRGPVAGRMWPFRQTRGNEEIQRPE
jgi:cytochrome b561